MSIDNNDEQQVAEPTVRLCVLRTWPDQFDGYGFNLHAEKSKTSAAAAAAAAAANGGAGGAAPPPPLPFSGGQYVGKVDRGSPAESAGLREGDRIVQVDGVDIEGETHATVVARIKKGSAAASGDDDAVSRCSLLVVDRRADTYYREKNIRVHADMGLQVLVLRAPEEPTAECMAQQKRDADAKTATDGGAAAPVAAAAAAAAVAAKSSAVKQQPPQSDNDDTAAKAAANATATAPPATATLNLNMTAAELRRRLAERKKQDSRRSGGTGDGSLDFRKKYEIVDKL